MAKIKGVEPYRDRAAKQNPLARCCWVCGRLGGQGFTTALRGAGYRMERGEMGYAHPGCMARAAKQAAKRQRAERKPVFQSLFLPTGRPNEVSINWAALGLEPETT